MHFGECKIFTNVVIILKIIISGYIVYVGNKYVVCVLLSRKRNCVVVFSTHKNIHTHIGGYVHKRKQKNMTYYDEPKSDDKL